MPACRAVLDTNVVLAAQRATNPASPNREILDRWKLGEFALLYSADIINEYGEKLLEHGFSENDVRSYLALVRLLGERVDIAFFRLRRYPGDADDIAFVLCALNGNATHLDAVCGQAVAAPETVREYRMLLYGTGEHKGLDEAGRPLRRGFSAQQIQAVLERKGRLTRWQMLRCRVRYFSDGAALGTRAFINEIFAARREHFGAKRTSGARPLRGVDATGLFTMRDLRVDAIG